MLQSMKLWDLRRFSERADVEEARRAVKSQHWDYRYERLPKVGTQLLLKISRELKWNLSCKAVPKSVERMLVQQLKKYMYVLFFRLHIFIYRTQSKKCTPTAGNNI
jgi:hypothetical protein